MSNVISISNQKGGVGKTTTTANVGHILSKLGYKVLCLDMDAQAHLSVLYDKWGGQERTIVNLIDKVTRGEVVSKEEVEQTIIHTDTIDLIASSKAMSGLRAPVLSLMDKEFVLFDIIALIKEDYDFVLIDCSSDDDIFTTNALTCSDGVIIPCQAQFLSAGGIDLMQDYISKIKKRLNKGLKLKGILMTMCTKTHETDDTIKDVKEKYADYLYTTTIPASTKVPSAQRKRDNIVEVYNDNIVSVSYEQFVKEEFLK